MNHNIVANILFCIKVGNLAHASMTEYTQPCIWQVRTCFKSRVIIQQYNLSQYTGVCKVKIYKKNIKEKLKIN